MLRSSVLLSLVLLGSGCVLSPPLRASAGAGGATGGVPVHARNGQQDVASSTPAMSIRGTVTPLANRDIGRPFDLGLGWGVDQSYARMVGASVVHGPVVDLTWFVYRAPARAEAAWRGGPFASLEGFLPLRIHDEKVGGGAGGSFGMLFELVGGHRERSDYLLVGGEWGLGLSARASVRRIDEETHAVVLFAVEVRTPGIAAAALPIRRNGLTP